MRPPRPRRRAWVRRRPIRGDPPRRGHKWREGWVGHGSRAGDSRRTARVARRGDTGMVTAEIAAALPALALVLAAAVWVVALAATQLRCADAAREAARAAARGENLNVVRQVAEEVAPGNVDVEIERSGSAVTVEVTATVPLPGPIGGSLPMPAVRGSAVAMLEAR